MNQHPSDGGAAEYFELDSQNGKGDGTVSVSSSKALIDANKNVQTNNATVRDDQGKIGQCRDQTRGARSIFSNADAMQFTRMAIRQLDWKCRYEKLGF